MLGQHIITNSSGIGEIVEVTSLVDDGELYYKVEFDGHKCINYYSVQNDQEYRLISTKKNAEKAIENFLSQVDSIDYETTQSKIEHQKILLQVKDICQLASNLSMIGAEGTPHPQVSKNYKISLNSLIEELVFILGKSTKEICDVLKVKKPY